MLKRSILGLRYIFRNSELARQSIQLKTADLILQHGDPGISKCASISSQKSQKISPGLPFSSSSSQTKTAYSSISSSVTYCQLVWINYFQLLGWFTQFRLYKRAHYKPVSWTFHMSLSWATRICKNFKHVCEGTTIRRFCDEETLTTYENHEWNPNANRWDTISNNEAHILLNVCNASQRENSSQINAPIKPIKKSSCGFWTPIFDLENIKNKSFNFWRKWSLFIRIQSSSMHWRVQV